MRPQLVKNGEPEEEETALIAALLSGKMIPQATRETAKIAVRPNLGRPPFFLLGGK